MSQAAQQLIDERVLSFADSTSAEEAFRDARQASSCRSSEFGDNGGMPTSIRVPGADEVFSIDYVTESSATSGAVARRGQFLVLVETDLHHGVATVDPVGSLLLATVAINNLG